VASLLSFILLLKQVESNRKYNSMAATLRRHDVVAMAERRRRNLVTTPAFSGCRCCYDPNSDGGEYQALMELRQARGIPDSELDDKKKQEVLEAPARSTEDSDDDSDDEFDYLLDEDLPQDEGMMELEDNRRAELELDMLHREVALHHGYGTHRQLHPGRVLKAAGLGDRAARDPPHAVVLHLVDQDSIQSASLDLYLETLAKECGGTVFCRSGGRSTLLLDPDISTRAFTRLDAESDMPCLVAIRDGVVVNTAPTLRGLHDGDEIEPRAVREWLDRCGVLVPQAPPLEYLCHIRPEEDALMDYIQTIKPAAEERFDCGLDECNKAFPHEHVGVKTPEQDGLVVKEEEVLDADTV
jgi:hypothetical protein